MRKLPIPFDNPATYKGHSGVDFGQPRGTPFRASDSGVVTWLGSNSRGGNFIWVQYDSIGPEVGYHHMDSHNGCPREGARFGYDGQLGLVGNSGHSTGPHLHSEVAGHATTDGYWDFFDPSIVVGRSGGNGSAPVVPRPKEKEDMDFINVQGKKDSHRAGQFAIYRGNADGKLYARRITFDTLNPAFPTIDNEGLANLQKAMPFIDLV